MQVKARRDKSDAKQNKQSQQFFRLFNEPKDPADFAPGDTPAKPNANGA